VNAATTVGATADGSLGLGIMPGSSSSLSSMIGANGLKVAVTAANEEFVSVFLSLPMRRCPLFVRSLTHALRPCG
jgi:hypothetical protein